MSITEVKSFICTINHKKYFNSTDSVVNETLRVSSGVFVVRSVLEDTEFEMENGQNFTVRKGDKVAMYPPAMHKDPEIFENPDVSILTCLFYLIYYCNQFIRFLKSFSKIYN